MSEGQAKPRDLEPEIAHAMVSYASFRLKELEAEQRMRLEQEDPKRITLGAKWGAARSATNDAARALCDLMLEWSSTKCQACAGTGRGPSEMGAANECSQCTGTGKR